MVSSWRVMAAKAVSALFPASHRTPNASRNSSADHTREAYGVRPACWRLGFGAFLDVGCWNLKFPLGDPEHGFVLESDGSQSGVSPIPRQSPHSKRFAKFQRGPHSRSVWSASSLLALGFWSFSGCWMLEFE